jgi:hypothetical protein
MRVSNPEAIKAAAKWWADQLRGTTFDNGVSEHNAMATMVQASNKPLSDEVIRLFQKYLEIDIPGMDWPTLSVDYDPDQILSAAGEAAGINLEFRLPWKTCMEIGDNEVQVACGYGKPFKTIYKKEDEA